MTIKNDQFSPFYHQLIQRGYADKTCRQKTNSVCRYYDWLGRKQANTYKHLLDYIKTLKSKQLSIQSTQAELKAIADYFDFLALTPNQAKRIKLQNGTKQIPHKLLTADQLKTIYELKATNGLINKRNKIILGLVLFQGLSRGELSKIEVTDVDLEQGQIYIPRTRTINSRTLDLQVNQALALQDYLLKIRPELLKLAQKADNNRLFFTQYHSKSVNGMDNVMNYLLKEMKLAYPKLKSLKQIRQSVISHWVKAYGLRKAQYMCGHKYVSSTEVYEENKAEALKRELDDYHPLN